VSTTQIRVNEAVAAYQQNPYEETYARLFEAQQDLVHDFYQEQANDFIARTTDRRRWS
jgi:hypothetical protein